MPWGRQVWHVVRHTSGEAPIMRGMNEDHSAWRLAATLRSVFDAVYKSYPTISDSRRAINEVLRCTLVREATLDILDEAGMTWGVAVSNPGAWLM